MPRTISEALTSSEINDLARIQFEVMLDYHLVQPLNNTIHINCMAVNGRYVAELYPSLKSPFLYCINSREAEEEPKRADAAELYERRDKRRAGFGRRRWEYVLDEVKIRIHDIEVHKLLLSQAEGIDVGWWFAAAHWLKEIGPDFYALCIKQHRQLKMDFELKGMEKAVGLVAPDKKGEMKYFAAVINKDFTPEERFAQTGSGVGKVIRPGTDYDIDAAKAERLRPRIEDLCRDYLCRLGGRR
jgi:hypothetical protein